MFKIVITGEKGGTGKSTITALLIEYLNYLGKTVNLLDTDPLQITTTFIQNCQEEGRILSAYHPDYQIVDTPGVLGASLLHINQAHRVIVPFRAHYADLLVIIPWFCSLNTKLKEKVFFLPNYWRNTKEQQEGLKKLKQTTQQEKAGQVLKPIIDKPALYGTVLNGNKENFFKINPQEETLKENFKLVLII